MKIPEPIIIGGLPFNQADRDKWLDAKHYSSTSVLDELIAAVKSDYPPERRASYFFNEIAFQLLNIAGWKDTAIGTFKFNFAGALYLLVKDNNLNWVRDLDQPLPDKVIVNGLPYTVTQAEDEYLEASGLLGEILYTHLRIKVKDCIPRAAKSWVLVHELTHALLYEANYDGDHNDDGIVTPLGSLLYLFFRDNDFKDAEPTTVNCPHNPQQEGDKEQ